MKLGIKLTIKFFRPVVFPMYIDMSVLDTPKIQALNAVFSYASNAIVRNSHAKHSIMTKNKTNFARAELKMFHSLNHAVKHLSFISFSSVVSTFFSYVSIKYLFGALNTIVSYAQVSCAYNHLHEALKKNQGLSGYSM